MEKSGIKSFIFSFVLTLSAVLLVDKMLPSAQKEIAPAKKISYQNIALFSDKKGDITVASASFSPAKSINIAEENEKIKEKTEVIAEKNNALPEKLSEQPTFDSEIVVSSAEDISEEKNIDVVFDPNKVADITPPEEYTFEELMAMNNLKDSEDFSEQAENNVISDQDNIEDINVADTSTDKNLNLWLPIEKGTTKIDLADVSAFSQVAMSDGSVMLSSVMEEEKAKVETLDDAILVAKTAGSEKTNKEKTSPWVVAKGAKHTKNRQSVATTNDQKGQIKEEKSFALNKITDGSEARAVSGILNKYQKKPAGSVDVAYKVVDNLIIPIPEEILEDDNLTPQLVASDNDDDSGVEEKEEKKEKKKEKSSKSEEKAKKKKSTLFESIGSFFSSSKSKKKLSEDLKEYDVDDEDEEDEGENKKDSSNKSKKSTEKTGKQKKTSGKNLDFPEFSEILPTEMKLSFQPEKAEISGSTLRWIRAFAENAKRNPDTYIEVRIDGSGAYALQQRRLSLLQGIFFENGVKPEKINTIFTAREPNSFVIRSIRIIEGKPKEIKKEKKPYYQMY